MLNLELKRTLRLKSTLIVTVLVLLCICAVPFLSLIGTSMDTIDEAGNYQSVSGVHGVQLRREAESVYDGAVTPEKLWSLVNMYQELRATYGQSIPNEVYIEELTPANTIILLLTSGFTEPGTYGYDRLLTLAQSDVLGFYQTRDARVEEYLTAQLGAETPAYRAASQMAAKVRVPFEVYSCAGWSTAAGNIGGVILIVMFAACIISSQIFSSEYQSGAHMILRAAQNGRRKLARTKVLSASIISGGIYILAILLYSLTCIAIFGLDGLKSPIQLASFLSPMPFTFGQVFALSAGMGFIAVLAMSAFAAFLSSRFTSSAFAMVISLSLIIVQQLLGGVSSFFVQFISNILPSSGAAIYGELFRINYFTFGSVAIWAPYIILLAGIIAIPLFNLLAIRSYCRHEAR